MRGEYLARPFVAVEYEELPPRARRIPVTVDFGRHVIRTTSACAENTFDGEFKGGFDRNYLRVRGEYLVTETFWPPYQELPPRARRIQDDSQVCDLHAGTTSACAENTHDLVLCNLWKRNYLRVRGEYRVNVRSMIPAWGTTSACAENTRSSPAVLLYSRNYLRVRGEYVF